MKLHWLEWRNSSSILSFLCFTWNEEWVMLAAAQTGGAGARPGGRMMYTQGAPEPSLVTP